MTCYLSGKRLGLLQELELTLRWLLNEKLDVEVKVWFIDG